MGEGEAWTVRRLLEWTTSFFTRKEVDAPRVSAELLLSHVLGIPRIRLYTDYEKVLPPAQLESYRALVKRASEHEPIAYLIGRAWFYGLEFEVSCDVLIPRPDTETLIEAVLHLVKNEPGFEAPRVLDLCTGSGCIAIAIAAKVKAAIVLGTDISEPAIAIARKNAERLGLNGRVAIEQGDLFDALKNIPDPQPFQIITANPPYIRSELIPTLDRNVRDYEPHRALDGGADGLTFHRRIIDGAGDRLSANGRLFMEIAFDQADQVKELASAHSQLTDIKILRDFAGNNRVLAARKA